MIHVNHDRILAVTAFVIATIFRVGVVFAILEWKFKLFKEIQQDPTLKKATPYLLFGAVITLIYFGKSIAKWIGGMRMNYFKGLTITIIEILPFVFIWFLMSSISKNIDAWVSASWWIMLVTLIGIFFSRLHDFFLQEAREKARFKKYGK